MISVGHLGSDAVTTSEIVCPEPSPPCAILDSMEPLFLVAGVAAGTVAIGAVLVAVRRGRTLRGLRRHLAGPDDQLEWGVRRLIDRISELEGQSGQLLRDASLVADLSGVAVLRIDADARVDFANLTAHRWLERAPGSLLGQTAIEAFIDRRIEEVAAHARERGFASGEVTVREPDGSTFLVRARRSPSGGAWVVLEEVSELRRLQRIRSEFIGNLSHELRTPLSTVSLLAEALANEAETAAPPIPPRMRDRIGKIGVETGHLVQMVNELLDLSRIEQGGPIALVHDVDLGHVATSSAERLRLFAERQGVDLRVEVARPISVVRGDESRLGQVIVNLLHNAIKFSPDGGVVMVRVQQDGESVLATVRDEGIGIPKAALPRIFERFYKVDRARVRGGGTGLGLAIARHVVEGHGGTIWVESTEGAGATFFFRIPAVSATAA